MKGSVTELPIERFAHGTRARYVKGCRCAPCRESNRLYYHQRKGRAFNGLVSAERARAHLLALSEAGVGRRAVAAACDVGVSTLIEIRMSRQLHVRADTERRILAVDAGARSDASLVDWRPTWKLVRQLQRWGWTLGRISQVALGNKVPALQLVGKKVLARTELAIKRLFEREKMQREHGCPRCGQSHGDDPTALGWCLKNLHVPVDDLEAA